MMRVAIMAHPSRRDRVEKYLLPRLTAQVMCAQGLGCDVIGPIVHEDTDGAGLDVMRRRCIAAAADHTLVVQDDVTVCADFIEAAWHLAHMRPEGAIVLAPIDCEALRRAHEFGRSWVQDEGAQWPRYNSSPCSILPDSLRRRVLTEPTHSDDDALMRKALAGASIFIPVPAIAIHSDMRSTKGHWRSGQRPPFVGEHARAPLEHYLRQCYIA